VVSGRCNYNTARADKGQPSLYHPLVRYILGDDDDAPQPADAIRRRSQGLQDDARRASETPLGSDIPAGSSRGGRDVGSVSAPWSLCRSLSLNSYVFWSILWRKGFHGRKRRLAVASLAEQLDMSVLTAPGGTISLRESSYPGFEVRAYLSKSRAMRPALKHFRE